MLEADARDADDDALLSMMTLRVIYLSVSRRQGRGRAAKQVDYIVLAAERMMAFFLAEQHR